MVSVCTSQWLLSEFLVPWKCMSFAIRLPTHPSNLHFNTDVQKYPEYHWQLVFAAGATSSFVASLAAEENNVCLYASSQINQLDFDPSENHIGRSFSWKVGANWTLFPLELSELFLFTATNTAYWRFINNFSSNTYILQKRYFISWN